MVKICVAFGDALHTKINEGAHVVGYLGRCCGYMPPLCRHNMRFALVNEESYFEHHWIHVDEIALGE